MKKAGPLVAGAAVAFATVIAVAPTANAETERVTQDREVTFTCAGTDAGNTDVSPNTFKVTYPEAVAPGEIFTVSVQPGEMRNNTRSIGRLTFDYALPTNATVIGVNLAGGEVGLGGVEPSVARVNDTTKTTDANGMAARIWGGASARFGTSNNAGSSSGGITVGANRAFQLPKLDVTLRAPVRVGTAVTIGLPGANQTHSGEGTAASTDLQWVRDRPGRRDPYQPAQCSSDSNAAALTTTTVSDSDVVTLPSSTTIAGGDRTLGPTQATEFIAQVTTEYGAVSQLPQGQVEFRNESTGDVLGTATPDADGAAKLDYTFDPLAAGQPDEIVSVVAEYMGVSGDVTASTSSPVTVTNTSKATVFHETRFDLRAQLGTETEAEVPVTINATIHRPGAVTIPDQALVQLYRDNTPVGDPQALPEGNQMTWTDTITRQQRTTTENYRAEFVEPVVIGYEEWTSASRPVSVIVTGTDPSLDPPLTGGDSGSLNIFGSLGNMFGS